MRAASHKAPFIHLSSVEFAWAKAPQILSIDEFSIEKGERIFLLGPSGSGKSSLLGIIAGIFQADSGIVQVAGHSLTAMAARARDRLRADAMGVIFQQFNLVPYLTLVENVLLPCRFSAVRRHRVGASQDDRRHAAMALLGRLGLAAETASGRPVSALSVGQQQRVAAARALIGAPFLIIADEPTSALDTVNRDAFIDTLLSEAGDAAVLFVSHDVSLAKHFDRQISMAQINKVAGGMMRGAA